MAILETFYILFKSDASNVKKGADDAEKSTKHLEESLKNVGRESHNVGASFAATAKSVLGLFAGVASISSVIQGFHAAVNEITEVGNLSRELNVNVEALDAWGHAVQRTGGTAAGFQSSLKSLSEHFGTTPAIALQLLPRLASAFSRMNQFQANQYGKSLGLDQSTIYLLQQGRREVEATIKQQKELGLVTQHQVDVTRKFDNALYDAGRAYNTFYRELAEPLLPGFTKAINYLIEHKDAVIGTMEAIGIAALALGVQFAKAFPWLTAFSAAVVAIGIGYEDIKGFLSGEKETALGKWLGYEKGQPGSFLKKQEDNSFHTDYFFKKTFGIDIASLKSLFERKSDTTLTVQTLNINTQATDATGIAASIIPNLRDQLSQTNSHFDDGVRA